MSISYIKYSVGGEMDNLKQDYRWVKYVIGVSALLTVAYFIDDFDSMTTNNVIKALLWTIRNVIHISLLIGWGASLQQRIINVRVRRCLVSVSVLMIFWLTAKVLKWNFIPDRTYWFGRYLWYSYYIPMILIPLLGVFIIDYMGKPEEYRNHRRLYALYIPAFAILIGIFTNDLHQLAFSFPQGIDQFDFTFFSENSTLSPLRGSDLRC